MNLLQALILAIIEGLTEFLPISSTGHMVIASSFMGIAEDDFTKLFEIVIQLAAILSVVVIYWRKFFDFTRIQFYIKLVIAVIPALLIGGLLKKHIESMLETPVFIATILLLGGFILLFVDNWFQNPSINDEKEISNKKAFAIGCYQTLAVIFPGLSRSAATIIGGMQQGLTRKSAAEFSFFLAVPTMLAATIKSIYDVYKDSPEVLNTDNLGILAIGNIVAFLVAYASIKFFIGFLTRNGFKMFGYYRIVLGVLLLIIHYFHPLTVS
ncbi:undecaprenyl-diphosphatase [Flavobacterium branchiophilum NBRC 15030 = ATCC 35035]|uniref:Undecaprenyl-diphosphatase n=1 Tax=Flavobacterium branchiophilum TaxID=55197 RepID=A0A2H3KAU3_9FLAO|nr:undecaprenyl-diphosphate phosphatase [Flavobacterium branchiophilum]OXA77770.1 undecaprenyl-diphosphatase [Flavobacterium branchiophilum NBRC 15030 = ATCC 35035]PDS23847.1 undecaprenyl-diphosphate phosphatase [Flavobacterium branchiophilum]TQM40072.1 undecaprenyl-diphosphatase [Flavobacterium branchiophilum]GEM56185.1 undecaprenyl-diphosphatase [Flavobacterium branchiophilum NBRC 15030 = ATCC 35035]